MNTTNNVSFHSYKDIIPEWEIFQECLKKPMPDGLRVNKLKTTTSRVRRYFNAYDIAVDPHPTLPDVFQWRDTERPASACMLHWLGSYYLQDPVTTLPVLALELDGDERVLDMCSAPGGKTLHIAQELQNGSVIANDINAKRRTALQSNIQRLGASNVIVTGYDGHSLPENEKFDAILVDAPCTGEGTSRRGSHPAERDPEDQHEKLSERQSRLIRKGYKLLEAGGVLIYSTCTYAPEENEAVVDKLLNQTSAQVKTIDQDRPHSPGINRWRDQRYCGDVEKLWRCYPHHYDSGGLVIAKIHKPERTIHE